MGRVVVMNRFAHRVDRVLCQWFLALRYPLHGALNRAEQTLDLGHHVTREQIIGSQGLFPGRPTMTKRQDGAKPAG